MIERDLFSCFCFVFLGEGVYSLGLLYCVLYIYRATKKFLFFFMRGVRFAPAPPFFSKFFKFFYISLMILIWGLWILLFFVVRFFLFYLKCMISFFLSLPTSFLPFFALPWGFGSLKNIVWVGWGWMFWKFVCL